MIKKIIAFAFGICLICGAVKAQTLESKFGLDSVKTVENASVCAEFIRRKKFKEALPAWRYVFNNAPRYYIVTYERGEDIIKNMYHQTSNQAYVDTLMMVYDQWIKYFGDHPQWGEGYVLGKKGMSLYQFGRKDNQTMKQAYGYMMKSFELDRSNVPLIMVRMLFLVANDLMQNNQISTDEYISIYMEISEYVNRKITHDLKSGIFKEIKLELDAMFYSSGVADCATLNAILAAKFEAKKDDLANLREICSLLSRSKCTDLPLYSTVAEQLYKIEPSAKDAYNLAILFRGRQDFEKTEIYLADAINISTNPEELCVYCLTMARLKLSQGQLRLARDNAMQAAQINPNNGQAFMVKGLAYASYSKNYGVDDFDHASVLWLAVDQFMFAKRVDPGLAEEANALIKNCSDRFPRMEDAFFRGINQGDIVRIGGWINESTVARFRY